MSLNRKTVLIGVMIVSAIAFLVDQVLLGGPASAEAQTQASDDSPAANIETMKTILPVKNEDNDPSLEWLDKLSEIETPARDIFATTEAFDEYYESGEGQLANGRANDETESESAPAEFENEHVLQATFLSNRTMMAIINGKTLRVGQEIGGFRIARIESHEVQCIRNGEIAVLRINVVEP